MTIHSTETNNVTTTIIIIVIIFFRKLSLSGIGKTISLKDGHKVKVKRSVKVEEEKENVTDRYSFTRRYLYIIERVGLQ